ncbi:hypothetical protein V2J09_012324 [Rumex salicifolius]
MMYGRAGLDRFKKAQSLEPFSVSVNTSSKAASQPSAKATNSQGLNSYVQPLNEDSQKQNHGLQKTEADAQITQVGGGQSTWQPPDWAIEPRPGVYYLEVLKDGVAIGQISLEKRRHIFGRQIHTCDFVLDHQSVSRQHAAVIPHKNGSVFVTDLGSAHGTFVANERLTKDTPTELEVGQSLRFAASTRVYVLRKNNAALFPPSRLPKEVKLPPPPDPSDEEAVVAYNTLLNRYGLTKSDVSNSSSGGIGSSRIEQKLPERAAKRLKRTKVAFKDQVGGELVEVVGISDGADVDTEPGPKGVKEGSLVGKYESLIQVTVVPKGKEHSTKEDKGNSSKKGVTEKLQEVLNKVKTTSTSKGGFYDDLYGDSLPGKVGSSWAYSSGSAVNTDSSSGSSVNKAVGNSNVKQADKVKDNDDDDDLFGD